MLHNHKEKDDVLTETDEILKLHEKYTGVLDINSELDVKSKHDLSQAYTPGVAVISKLIAENPQLKNKYTMSGKLIALITDGSAVLGLGNIGPAGGLPVIEGKALLYKDLSGIDAIPIAIDQVDVDEFVSTIKNTSLSFAGIHLEDIAAPRCFDIEEKLKRELDIPVYHDDQEGTAIVVLAGLINSLKLVGKKLETANIIVNGVGASGLATANLLYEVGAKHITLVDINGVITGDDEAANNYQKNLAQKLDTPSSDKHKSLSEVISGQDVFIGLSDQDVLTDDDVKQMDAQPIIFALANPKPEINPQVASEAGAAIVATGSSQYPNQVNNILAFPGLFKGLLESGIKQVDSSLQKAVALALADVIEKPTKKNIVPSVFDKKVVPSVVNAIVKYASENK
ncbi:malic enzyme, NAD-dependent [Secundilactobacillus oryzae JCM 18671]|uniref:Malic enzyme, NAD-dependent n=1 Tax=Secundilactobacillus oryzae JCM 18671 TaxID=1291743 RepID=A0A081BHP7_9LACO|nr:malic enzyme, NAD-dependent [Secundilactobacillus oryzae JCM 18671]